MAANFSTLFLLTLLGLGLSFPYHAGQQLASNGMQQRFAHNGMQQRSNAVEQQQPAPMALQQQQPAPMPVQSPNGMEQQPAPMPVQSQNGMEQQPAPMPVQSPNGMEQQPVPDASNSNTNPIDSDVITSKPYLPTESADSAVIPPPQQTPPIESVESGIMDPIDNETDSTQVIVETLTEAERSHLISYFLCEMCRELQVSMCMRICNGEETDGSGAEIEGSGAETESREGSGQDGGDTVIIVVEESSAEGSGQESSNNGNGAEASGNEGSGEESEASGDN